MSHDCESEKQTAGKFFGKICVKAIRDTVFPICGLRSRKGRAKTWSKVGRLNFLVGVIPNTKVHNFGHEEGPPHSLPLWVILTPHKEQHKECAWSVYYIDFEKSVREYFLSKQQIHSMYSERWKRGCKIFDVVQSV